MDGHPYRAADLSDWKNLLLGKAAFWAGAAVAAGAASPTGVGGVLALVALGYAASFASAHGNASDVYDRLCDGR